MRDNAFFTYEAFGAVGDGITDDFKAICACHACANERRVPVKVAAGKYYYIGAHENACEIRTDTDFGDAHFIIDDTELRVIDMPVFRVARDREAFEPSVRALPAGTKRLELGVDAPCYVRLFSDEKRVFIRKGLNMNNGVDLSDCLLTDAEGNLLTEPDYVFERVTKAEAYRTDDVPITVSGGHFLTLANRAPSFYNYHHRGIDIVRSHVTVRDLEHVVSGEGEQGAPYAGFITVESCADFTIRDCVLTPHFTYWTESKIPGELVPMGSYDFSASAVIGLTMKNITQTVDIMDTRYWGLMGTNFCKNIKLEGCVISRFDAHQGVTNLEVKNCRLGHMCFNLIGHGTVRLENSEAFGRALINLRSDYGSNFDGTLILKNNVWKPSGSALSVLWADNTGDHDFGYPCRITRELIIDGLTILDGETGAPKRPITILPDYDPGFAPGKPFAPIGPERVEWRNVRTETGRPVITMERPEEYPNLTVVTDREEIQG